MKPPTKVVWHRLDIETNEFSTFKMRTPVILTKFFLPEAIAQCQPHPYGEGWNMYGFVDVTPIVRQVDEKTDQASYTPGISTLWWFGKHTTVMLDLMNATTAALTLSLSAVECAVELATIWQDMVTFSHHQGLPIEGEESPFDMVMTEMNLLRKLLAKREDEGSGPLISP